jgi:general secretion pathway protein L
MKNRLQDEFDKFLTWWSEGLALIVPKRWRGLQQRFKHYLIVRRGTDEIVIEHYRIGAATPTMRQTVSMHDPLDQNHARDWLENNPRIKALPVILRLAPNDVLVKRLRYPSTVRGDLRNVIAFDIDRQTPFSRDDVYFDYDEVVNGKTNDSIEIDLVLLPKRAIGAIEPVLETIGLRLAVIDIVNRTFFDHQINLLPKPAVGHNVRPGYRTRFALLMLWMLLIALIPGKQLLETRDTIHRLEAEERSAREAVRALNELRAEYARLTGKFDFIRQLETEHIAAIDLLDEVTRLLTVDTWIHDFNLKNDTLTLRGESSKASEIPAILEGSAYFSSPRFSSPLTRDNASGKDHFQIVVTVQSPRSS